MGYIWAFFVRIHMRVCKKIVIYLGIKTPQSRKERKYTWEKTARISCHNFETNGRPYYFRSSGRSVNHSGHLNLFPNNLTCNLQSTPSGQNPNSSLVRNIFIMCAGKQENWREVERLGLVRIQVIELALPLFSVYGFFRVLCSDCKMSVKEEKVETTSVGVLDEAFDFMKKAHELINQKAHDVREEKEAF